MREEYVVRICRRDPDHPLAETTLTDFGVDVTDPRALADALDSYVKMLRHLVTPEAVVKFMLQNAALSQLAKANKG